MIRYYESIGLIRPAARSEAGYRLSVTRTCTRSASCGAPAAWGFPWTRSPPAWPLARQAAGQLEVKAVATRHVRDLEARIAEMQAMVRTLSHLDEHCSGDDRPDCPILDDLAGTAPGPPRVVPITGDARNTPDGIDAQASRQPPDDGSSDRGRGLRFPPRLGSACRWPLARPSAARRGAAAWARRDGVRSDGIRPLRPGAPSGSVGARRPPRGRLARRMTLRGGQRSPRRARRRACLTSG